MGRLICMLDPAEVAVRNKTMKAALKDPARAIKPPPEPRLGPGGAYREDDPNAGYLSLQGRVKRGARLGLLDDIVGTGWQLLLFSAGGVEAAEAKAAAARLDVLVVDFGPSGDTVDVDGSYARWFGELDAEALLVRPDFYVFGTAPLAGVADLLEAARPLMPAASRRTSVATAA